MEFTDRWDCGICAAVLCPDHGKPHNQRAMTEEECRDNWEYHHSSPEDRAEVAYQWLHERGWVLSVSWNHAFDPIMPQIVLYRPGGGSAPAHIMGCGRSLCEWLESLRDSPTCCNQEVCWPRKQ